MKIVFFGTPEFVVPIVDEVHKSFKTRSGESPIVAVVTQAPKPTGRKQILTYSPIDTWAYKREIPVFHDSLKLKSEGLMPDLGIVAAYGSIIPEEVIKLFPQGVLNVHPSLLPKWRGASPVQATLISGEKQTGVTIIKLDQLMDHGPIVSQFKEEVLENDTTETLRNRLFERSKDVLISLIEPYVRGKINLKEQNHNEATFTKLIQKEHGFIPPEVLETVFQGGSLKKSWEIQFIKDYSITPDAAFVERFIRAMSPWPGAWTKVKLQRDGVTKRLRILKAHIKELLHSGYCIVPEIVQVEGKNPVSWEEFKKGYPNAEFTEEY